MSSQQTSPHTQFSPKKWTGFHGQVRIDYHVFNRVIGRCHSNPRAANRNGKWWNLHFRSECGRGGSAWDISIQVYRVCAINHVDNNNYFAFWFVTCRFRRRSPGRAYKLCGVMIMNQVNGNKANTVESDARLVVNKMRCRCVRCSISLFSVFCFYFCICLRAH